jgi:hypothetical protein
MQVSNTETLYSTQSPQNLKQVFTEELSDKSRENLANLAGHRSKQAQIDVYVQSTKNANEQYDDLYDNENATENYMDFSSDVRRSENYATFLENGGELSEILDRPSIQPIENPENITDENREVLADIAGRRSTQNQIDAYKAGSQQSSDSNNNLQDTQEYVTNYNDFAQQARRSEYINTYIENSKQFA